MTPSLLFLVTSVLSSLSFIAAGASLAAFVYERHLINIIVLIICLELGLIFFDKATALL